MTDSLLAILPDWGPWLVGFTVFAACLLLPAPASLLLIAAGAFVSSGDLDLSRVALAALIGSIAGDQTAFQIARAAGGWLDRRSGRAAELGARARRMLARRGTLAVFLSRWLFSPLGPWMTVVAGATGFPRARFTLASTAGAAVWVTIYLGLGIVFGTNFQAAADLAGSALGLIAASALAITIGLRLFRRRRTPPE